MILGVSHIVLSSTRLEGDRRTLEGLGWKTTFIERDLPTHPGKQPFMSTASGAQSLAFLEPPGGTPVELIYYADEIKAAPAPLQIVLPNRPSNVGENACAELESVWPAAFAQPAPRAVNLPNLTAPLCFAADGADSGAIIHFVSDLNAARHFWTDGLGFQPTSSGADWVRLEFRSLMPQWRATLLLARSARAGQPSLLDGPGFRCLSMVCSDLATDRNRLRQAGSVDSTGPMVATVNGKELDLEICAGPDGVMIELLQLSARRS
jgi:catechol 2,3-dioxygenase-like lactoylglutathione lyase family enzyme